MVEWLGGLVDALVSSSPLLLLLTEGTMAVEVKLSLTVRG